jgi:hypothetical protein
VEKACGEGIDRMNLDLPGDSLAIIKVLYPIVRVEQSLASRDLNVSISKRGKRKPLLLRLHRRIWKSWTGNSTGWLNPAILKYRLVGNLWRELQLFLELCITQYIRFRFSFILP